MDIKIHEEQEIKKLSVVVPVYNESRTVGKLIDLVLKVPISKEIIIVDDGSTDGTRQILDEISHPDVTILYHERNQGKGSALRTAFREITGDIVIVQDADLEYNPEDYLYLLEPIKMGLAEVVYGSRFSSSSKENALNLRHYVGNRFLTIISNYFTGLNISDTQTCYKVFSRSALENMTIVEDRFGVDTELTAKLAKKGLRFSEVPISYLPRSRKEGKKLGIMSGPWILWCILKYNLLGS
jgi:glycosyltransferase involved in cell wall biosynthesis